MKITTHSLRERTNMAITMNEYQKQFTIEREIREIENAMVKAAENCESEVTVLLNANIQSTIVQHFKSKQFYIEVNDNQMTVKW